jgi:hypothetical protein
MANTGYDITRTKMPTFVAHLPVRGLVSYCVPA